jgi:DNA-binding transcriptional LysR family regulator
VEIRIIEGRRRRCRACATNRSISLGPSLRAPPGRRSSRRLIRTRWRSSCGAAIPAGKRSLADLLDSESITAGLGTASLVVDDMFTAAGLPTPRWAIRCESIPGLIAITAQSDLIATVPKSLLVLGIADRLLEPIRVREKMASSTMSLFMKRDLPLNAAAGRLVRLIKDEAKRLRATR